MDDLMRDFLAETSESLAILDVELVKFEQDPSDAEILMNIFRLMHTIKGTCGFLGLARLEKVAHAGEDVLGKFRDGELSPSPKAVSLILTCIDRIREILAALEEQGSEPDGNDEELIGRLAAMAAGAEDEMVADGSVEEPTVEEPTVEEPTVEEATVEERTVEEPAADEIAFPDEAAQDEDTCDEGAPVCDGGFPIAAELVSEVEAALREGCQPATDQEIAAECLAERAREEHEPASATAVEAAEGPAPAAKDKAAGGEDRKAAPAPQSIRVSVDVLETLMTMVSELVLTRNNLLQMVRGRDDSEFLEPLQRLSLITTDLQEGVMKTRMQPVGNAWSKLPRIVRDLAVESGKKLDLQMIGAETELDRQVLELIKDPLMHMVRNSADHGIEMPRDRVAAGKPEMGIISLRAFHEGGHIIIEIKDDGRGLTTRKIREKVIATGLATEAELDGMSENQIQQFIFKAGFSTAETVTNVSGRGVGMDVVRSNIEKIGGTIELKSTAGKGSTFTIKIPLTLAIVSALIVECMGERFAIPQLSVRELVRVSPNSENTVEVINDTPVLRLRNRLLPLVSLHELLALDQDKDLTATDYFVVVTQVGAHNFGIVVDQVFDTEEIVVKPVARMLRKIPFYSGNTILGDGSVIMILDPNGIATQIGQPAVTSGDGGEHITHYAEQRSSLIVFRAGGDALKAVPMGLVARLEDVDMATVEHANGRAVVQYRGHLMPLIDIEPGMAYESTGKKSVLVFSEGERWAGLVVDEIIDIIDEHLQIGLGSSREGVIGTAIINGKATDLIDIAYYLTQAFSDWFGGEEYDAPTATVSLRRKRVLLVDDSRFFLNLLSPQLAILGYDVVTAEGAAEALALRDKGQRFDLIVSDIDMPGMNGFDFAKAVHNEGKWEDVPMIALSSHTARSYMDRGRDAGFIEFVPKSRRNDLLTVLNRTLEDLGEAA